MYFYVFTCIILNVDCCLWRRL